MTLRKKPLAGLILGALVGGGPHAADPVLGEAGIPRRLHPLGKIMQSLDDAARQAEEAAEKLEALQASPAIPSDCRNQAGGGHAGSRHRPDLSYFTPPVAEVGGFEIDTNYVLTEKMVVSLPRFPKAAWCFPTPMRAISRPLAFRIEPGDKGHQSRSSHRRCHYRTQRRNHSRPGISRRTDARVWDDTGRASVS
ncbi:MAG: hypothetical protein R3F37_03405 [Candidatus Competibacteraceae bacterium]